MNVIKFYTDRNYFLDNCSAFTVKYQGVRYMTAEHAYQCAKFSDEDIREIVQEAGSPFEAKKQADRFHDEIKSFWQQVKLEVMEEILCAKLEQHPNIQSKLWDTGQAELIENSPTDYFWGIGLNGDGQNHLGKLWMKIRSEMRSV